MKRLGLVEDDADHLLAFLGGTPAAVVAEDELNRECWIFRCDLNGGDVFNIEPAFIGLESSLGGIEFECALSHGCPPCLAWNRCHSRTFRVQPSDRRSLTEHSPFWHASETTTHQPVTACIRTDC